MSKGESPEDETLGELTSHFDPFQCREGDCITTLRWLVVDAELLDIDVKFGFLLDVQRICCNCDFRNLESLCDNLASVYSDNLDGKQLYGEIIYCKMLISGRINVRLSRPENLLSFIVEYGDKSVFPNLRIALQILLIVGVSTESCERSFSKLKLILSYLRSSISQKRLCDLALLSIERDETKKTTVILMKSLTNLRQERHKKYCCKTLLLSDRPNFLLLIV